MFTTEHRPAPLPNEASADGAQARPQVRQPSRDPDGKRLLPPGAVTFSWHHAGPTGATVKARQPVPVNDAGNVTHLEWHCPDCLGSEQWMSATSKTVPICSVHHSPLRVTRSEKQAPVLPPAPWAEMFESQQARIKATAATLAVGALGVAADVADLPWVGEVAQFAAVPACVAGSWWLTRAYLNRRVVKRGRLDPADEVAGKRVRRLIARRARTAGYVAAAAGVWVELADAVNMDPSTGDGGLAIAACLGLGVLGSRPYRAWVDDRKRRALERKPEPAEPAVPEPTDRELLALYVQERWAKVSAPRRVLAGTALEGVEPTVGGWTAIIVADEDSDLDPEKFDLPEPVRKIARAYNVGTSMVSIIADPLDANRAMILVQRTSPLQGGNNWDGSGIDPALGSAETVTLEDGTRGRHPFWRPGWGAVMELIAGCTGSGKSEYLNLLLALERQSGHVVSWVGDPQMGQSLGDVRDGVDWFAPTVEEILIMLRCAAMVMIARNLLVTRMRVTETRPNGKTVQRRIKYLDVSPAFPLLSVSIDEAHLPMGDPDHGKEIVQLLALLSKSGRKANVKIRLLTQSPLLSELKNSVLRAQLSSGLVAVFRTSDRITGDAAWPGGKLPGNPASLPAEWDDGSTTAGLGYLSSVRRMRMRADYPGDLFDLLNDGDTLGLEPSVLGTAGAAYADRWKRLEAFDTMDPAELLGAGIPAGLFGSPDDDESKPVGGREAVLRFFADRWLEGDRDPVPFGDVAKAVRDVVKTRACTNVCNKLVSETVLASDDGKYWLTEVGAEQLGLDEDPA